MQLNDSISDLISSFSDWYFNKPYDLCSDYPFIILPVSLKIKIFSAHPLKRGCPRMSIWERGRRFSFYGGKKSGPLSYRPTFFLFPSQRPNSLRPPSHWKINLIKNPKKCFKTLFRKNVAKTRPPTEWVEKYAAPWQAIKT